MRKYIVPIVLVGVILAVFLYKMYLDNDYKKEKIADLIGYKISLTQVDALFDADKRIDILPADDSKNIIHIFTTWCSCCKKEIPEIKKIAKDHKITGLVWTQDMNEAREWLKVNGNYYENVGVVGDKETVMLGIIKTPVTMVLDKTGSVLCLLSGPLTIERFNDNIFPCIGK